jgi:hypothetical protein
MGETLLLTAAFQWATRFADGHEKGHPDSAAGRHHLPDAAIDYGQ